MKPVTWQPRPYQDTAINHLLSAPRVALWAGMGMGKTVSTLTALDLLQALGERAPTLVVAPLRVAKTTWPAEARKWLHLRDLGVCPILGDAGERMRSLRMSAAVYSTNYENLPWLVEYWGKRWPYRTVVADESTRLKGFRLKQGTARARALARVSRHGIKRFIQLTGTPSPNGLKDLWGQLWFLDRGQRLGVSYDAFVKRWFLPSPTGYGVEPTAWAERQIHDAIGDICLTIDPADHFDLEEPIVNNIYIDLPTHVVKQYREMERELLTAIQSKDITAVNAGVRTQKCMQIANGAVYYDEDGRWVEAHGEKLDALESIIEEAGGMPVLVAYQYRSDLERLRKRFPQGRVLDKKTETIDAWNAGTIPVLFAHPGSAGHGLNLQDGGNILVFFSQGWNLEERLQIIERIGPVRQLQAGHKRAVFVHQIIARDTIEEVALERVESKQSVQDALLAAMKRRTTTGAL